MKSILLSVAVLLSFSALAQFQPQYPGTTQYDTQGGFDQYQGQYQEQYQQQLPQYPDNSFPHNPQYPMNPPKNDQQWIAQEAFNATNGACNFGQNVHSYACTHWNYAGNQVFPLFQLDWDYTLQGEWFSVTYVNPETENNGPEFFMAKNPHNTNQPLGMYNRNSNTPVGSMWIQGNTMVWNNWLGITLQTSPQSFRWLDAYTVEMQAIEGPYVHLFRCRDFNRNNNHHLLCSWDMFFSQQNVWKHKGYIGFLTRQVWDKFANGHH